MGAGFFGNPGYYRIYYDRSHAVTAAEVKRVANTYLTGGRVVLSIVPMGLGFLAILRDPSRHAWHDRLTGTEVVYDTAARSAPYAKLRADERQL